VGVVSHWRKREKRKFGVATAGSRNQKIVKRASLKEWTLREFGGCMNVFYSGQSNSLIKPEKPTKGNLGLL